MSRLAKPVGWFSHVFQTIPSFPSLNTSVGPGEGSTLAQVNRCRNTCPSVNAEGTGKATAPFRTPRHDARQGTSESKPSHACREHTKATGGGPARSTLTAADGAGAQAALDPGGSLTPLTHIRPGAHATLQPTGQVHKHH